MSHTIQAAITFSIAFALIICILFAGPFLYACTDRAANIFYLSKVTQTSNSQIFRKDTIVYAKREADVIYTSPERMQFFISAAFDSLTLIIEGVKKL